MTAVAPRSAIAPEQTWNIGSVFPNEAAWEAAFAAVEASLPDLQRFQGHLADGPQTWADWLAAQEALQRSVDRVYVYASMAHNVDTTDAAATAKYDQVRGLTSRAATAVAFAEPELLAIGLPTLREWVKTTPALSVYAHYLDQLERKQAHVRSAEVEEVLGLVRDPFSSTSAIHGTLADADLHFAPAVDSDGESHELTKGTVGTLLLSADRELRRTTWENYADAHLTLKHGFTNCLSAGAKQTVFLSRVRRYESALDAALTSNFVPASVFHNLLDTYRRHLPTWHRYWRIRRQALGVAQFHEYDTWAPLTPRKIEVPFTRAVDWIAEGMQPLGDDYVNVLRRGMGPERWVDRSVNLGKRSGAYSSGVPGTHPFILMSYNDSIYAMSTLAHEIGHSMHSFYSWQHQPLVYSDYSLFVAEVASNFNQALVRAHLLETLTDRDMQITLIEEAMANFRRYFFIMPTLARFELEVHQRSERGEGLTADGLIALMAGLFQEGYGDEVVMDVERIGSTWMHFSTHLYYPFYVYQYATGIAAAHALADKVRQGGDAPARYLQFLQAGGSVYPLDALKLAGVDMNTPEPVEQTFNVLAGLVDRLEALTQ